MRAAQAILPGMRLLALAGLFALLPPSLRSQDQVTVALPHDTGKLTVSADWTVLGPEQLATPSRAGDPTGQHSRALLLAILAEIRASGELDNHLVLYRTDEGFDRIRIVHAYSAPTPATGEELVASADRIRNAHEENLAGPGREIVFHGQDTPPLFEVPCLEMTFRVDEANGSYFDQLLVVPAGERLQYFESIFAEDDLDAPPMVRIVAASFDGARDPLPDDTLRKMLLGGVAGALAGVMVAMLRARRHRRACALGSR